MYLPRFLIGMVAVLLALAAWIYTATGSFLTALIWTLIGAVLLQIGYFLVVVVLVYRQVLPDETSQRVLNETEKVPGRREGIIAWIQQLANWTY